MSPFAKHRPHCAAHSIPSCMLRMTTTQHLCNLDVRAPIPESMALGKMCPGIFPQVSGREEG